MKSTVICGHADSEEYPCLKQSNMYIVLFTSRSTGTVVHVFDKPAHYHSHTIGDYSKNWNHNNFTPFNGVVSLASGGPDEY